MADPVATPNPLHLLLGEEELLVERTIAAVFASVRMIDEGAELRRVAVTDITPPELEELLGPSLFAEARVIVLDNAQEIGRETAEAVHGYLDEPADGVVLMIVHRGGGRAKVAKELPARLRKAGAEVVECAKITKPAEREAFVRQEIRGAGGRIAPGAVGALIDAVGSDLRELASTASQLVADSGGVVDEAAVRRYHRGRAEITGFAVADKAIIGDTAAALEALRWALRTGVPTVLIADALADAVRTVGRVGAVGGGDPFRLSGELGMPPWKIKKAQAQSRGWTAAGIAVALRVVADLNADVKGVAASADHALERSVLRIAAARAGNGTHKGGVTR